MNSKCYKVVGDNIFAHSQEIILTPWKTTSMVKTTILRGKKMKDIFYLDVEQHTSNIVLLSMFIDLFGSSSEEDLLSLV
jgi:hypothetical protein